MLSSTDPVHLPEKHLPERTFPQKTLGRMYIFQNGHLPECTFGRIFPQMYIFQNGHLPECTFGRMDISPNLHFPELTFGRMDTCQNVQLMLAIIIQDDKIKLFCSVSRVNICCI